MNSNIFYFYDIHTNRCVLYSNHFFHSDFNHGFKSMGYSSSPAISFWICDCKKNHWTRNIKDSDLRKYFFPNHSHKPRDACKSFSQTHSSKGHVVHGLQKFSCMCCCFDSLILDVIVCLNVCQLYGLLCFGTFLLLLSKKLRQDLLRNMVAYFSFSSWYSHVHVKGILILLIFQHGISICDVLTTLFMISRVLHFVLLMSWKVP